jgi:hypothetical protein
MNLIWIVRACTLTFNCRISGKEDHWTGEKCNPIDLGCIRFGCTACFRHILTMQAARSSFCLVLKPAHLLPSAGHSFFLHCTGILCLVFAQDSLYVAWPLVSLCDLLVTIKIAPVRDCCLPSSYSKTIIVLNLVMVYYLVCSVCSHIYPFPLVFFNLQNSWTELTSEASIMWSKILLRFILADEWKDAVIAWKVQQPAHETKTLPN